MGGYGRQILESTGRDIQVLVDPENADWKAGGVTIDWGEIDAVASAPETLPDDTVVAVGDKYIRFGTVITRDAATGLYAPTDTPVRGESFIVNKTVVKSELGSDHPAVFEGGQVWAARLLTGGDAPLLEAILAAFPRLQLVTEEPVEDFS